MQRDTAILPTWLILTFTARSWEQCLVTYHGHAGFGLMWIGSGATCEHEARRTRKTGECSQISPADRLLENRRGEDCEDTFGEPGALSLGDPKGLRRGETA